MTAWLLNFKKLVLLSGLSAQLRDFDFLDVGCGKGIICLYAADQFGFRSISGFDFENEFISLAKLNHQSSRLKSKPIEFLQSDAKQIILKPKRYFIFMFNPFRGTVLREFMKNNIQTLKNTGSVLAYAYCNELEVIQEFQPKEIRNYSQGNSAVIFF